MRWAGVTPFLHSIRVWNDLSAFWRVCSQGRRIDTLVVVKHLKEMIRSMEAEKSRRPPPALVDSLSDIPPLLDSINPSSRSGARTPSYASGRTPSYASGPGARTPSYAQFNEDMWNGRSSTVASWTAGMDSLCAVRWCVCMSALP